MKRACLVVLVALASVCWSQEADAAPVTVNFTGVLTQIVDPALGATFSIGDLLSGSYTFESTTAPRNPNNPGFIYYDALLSLNATLGSYSFSSTSSSEILVFDSFIGPGDLYSVVSRASQGLTGAPVGGFNLDVFTFNLQDSTGSLINPAMNLPTNLRHPGYTFTPFFFLFTDPNTGTVAAMQGVLTSVTTVPEPTALAVAAFGVAALVARRRYARRS